jgi:hypothetical protein
MKRAMPVFLIAVLLTTLLTPALAQDGWLITAGRGWGPIYLGMTEDAAIGILGAPKNDTGEQPKGLHVLNYPNASLLFGLFGQSQTYTLFQIEVR